MSKKIYIISQSYAENKGSFSGFVENFAKYASLNGYKIVILCGQKENEKKFEKLQYAEVYRFPIKKAPFFRNVFEVLSLSRNIREYFKRNPLSSEDIILTNGEASLSVMNKKYVLRSGDQPAFIFLKNMEIAKSYVSLITRIIRAIHLFILFLFESLYVGRANAILYPSNESRKLFMKYYYNRKKSYFIPRSGVNIKELENGKKLLIKGRTLLFISLYEERIRKGVMYLEKILPEIFEKFRDVKLIHVGEKFSWNVPEEYKERIISVGKVPWEKMKDYYASADVFVSCSLNEGFPNAILEAMAAGCPIVSSDIEGIREYITHLKEGYIYRRGDYNALKEGIIYMLENPKEREEMAKRAKEKVKKLDYSIYSEKLLEFLENVKEGKAKSVNLLE